MTYGPFGESPTVPSPTRGARHPVSTPSPTIPGAWFGIALSLARRRVHRLRRVEFGADTTGSRLGRIPTRASALVKPTQRLCRRQANRLQSRFVSGHCKEFVNLVESVHLQMGNRSRFVVFSPPKWAERFSTFLEWSSVYFLRVTSVTVLNSRCFSGHIREEYCRGGRTSAPARSMGSVCI